MKTRRVLAFGTAMIWASYVSSAGIAGDRSPFPGPFDPAPGTEKAAFYAANAAAIADFAGKAKIGEIDARRAAFESFVAAYRDPALNLATELIKDPDPNIAVDSARLLAETLGMAGHLRPGAAAAFDRHEAAKAALREVLDDRRIVVRQVAARTLAGFGDAAALERIDHAVAAGAVPAVEAIDYFGLAPSAVAGSYVQKYLQSGPIDAQDAAVEYLATIPGYQPLVREMVLGNPNALEPLRAKAAVVLGKYDNDFLSYALEFISDDNLPVSVSSAVARCYVEKAFMARKRGSVDWDIYVQAVNQALVRHPEYPDLQLIKTQLENGHF